MCSFSTRPRLFDQTTWTAVAFEAVGTFRTYADTPPLFENPHISVQILINAAENYPVNRLISQANPKP